MNALKRLSALLHGSLSIADKPMLVDDSLDAIIKQLEVYTKAGTGTSVTEDLQWQAVRRFWNIQRFENLKNGRLVSFGMCLPYSPSGSCIMEDHKRFHAVLAGVDQWLDNPRWYRRCYQGLMRSYFAYDAKADSKPAVGHKNWYDLRDYLYERAPKIVDNRINPNWVTTVLNNRNVFTEDACALYAESILQGNSSVVDQLCEDLGIDGASWFLQELILAQVRQAIKFEYEKFVLLIPFLLELLTKNLVFRDRGLILLLDKYASVENVTINAPLRNTAVYGWGNPPKGGWGNPWLPSTKTCWGGVMPATRNMVSEWLKHEFIEAFFTKLAEDGVGDRRRASFWLRYVKCMDHVQFALGAKALNSRDPDFVELRKKMKGLYTELKPTDSFNNAFVMTIGNLVAVEFGGMGNAFYGYDTRKTLPFDISQPVTISVNAKNSLKHDKCLLKMRHQDGIKGWNRWEDMFEATLRKHFDIRPNAGAKSTSARSQV